MKRSVNSNLNCSLEYLMAHCFRIPFFTTIGSMSAACLVGFISCTSPTSQPSALEAPSGVQAEALSSYSVRLTWNGVDGATWYEVYDSCTGRSGYENVGSNTLQEYLDNSVTPQQGTHYYRIKAGNSLDGRTSALSKPVAITPPYPTLVPPVAIAAYPLSGMIRVTFVNPCLADSFRIYCAAADTVSGADLRATIATRSYTISGLTNGTRYAVSVASVRDTAFSIPSRCAKVKPQALGGTRTGQKLISGGTFTMGADNTTSANSDQQPAHQVTLSSFYMDSTEVTLDCFYSVMGANYPFFNACGVRMYGEQYRDYGTDFQWPASGLSWYDAILYCNSRSILEGLDTVYRFSSSERIAVVSDSIVPPYVMDTLIALNNVTADFARNGYRLPAEAEWEYACLGGSTTMQYWGDQTDDATAGQYEFISGSWQEPPFAPVATKRPNGFGLYDMMANASEWCFDLDSAYALGPQTDPIGPSRGTARVFRGYGGSPGFATWITPKSRNRAPGNMRLFGFRCVRKG